MLTNGPQLPLWVAITCLNGFFHDLYTESLAETLLKADPGGAVAVWTSSGLILPNGQARLNQKLFRLLFQEEGLTLGEATMWAKLAVPDLDIRRTTLLFGDPTLRLKVTATGTSALPSIPMDGPPSSDDTHSASGGGGCALSPGTHFDPILFSLLGLIGLYFVCKHAQSLSYCFRHHLIRDDKMLSKTSK